ncbi:MAG: carotenoid oxygenase family protein [Spirochaetaceae bacterium]|nr:MAG: carotenoid oxygenase family protein [Spirochaetaceae bacterium]
MEVAYCEDEKKPIVITPAEVFNAMSRRGAQGALPQDLSVVSGAVPVELSGTLFRVGPGRLQNYGLEYDHLFDGDGFVQRFSFSQGAARFCSSYVETPQFTQEKRNGKPLFRSFGTNLPGGLFRNAFRFNLKNAANTTPLMVNGDVLMLWEGGAPHRIDPQSLAYRGHWTGGGALRSRTLVERIMGNGRPFSAHPKRIPGIPEVFNFGLSPGLRQRLLLYRVNPETGSVKVSETVLPRLTFMHDFAVTASGMRVFFDVGVAFHLLPAFAGLIPPAASIREDSNAETIIRVFDKADQQHIVPGPSGYVFHIPNGYDVESETETGTEFIVDACWLQRFPETDDFHAMLNDRFPRTPLLPTLTRHTINLTKNLVRSEELSEYSLELPAINPAFQGRRHRYIWGVAEPPTRRPAATMFGIAKVDTDSRSTRYRDYYPLILGEPVFVASGTAEDQGYLLLLAFDPQDSQGLLLILRAEDLEEVARLALPEPTPLGFHGLWVGDEE